MLINSAVLQPETSSPWQECLSRIRAKIGPASYETWFQTIELEFDNTGSPRFLVPNRFFADFIEEHFSVLLRECLILEGLPSEKLSFVPVEKDWKLVETLSETLSKVKMPEPAASAGSIKGKLQFHPNYTFDSFVIGESNRMAHAAARAVAEAPGKTSFNPLVMYGGTGLGKTHLLQAIGHFAQTEGTCDNAFYLSSEEFTRRYIDFVVHKKDSTSFFRMFNDVDLLLIDDIHFFSGKPSTQNQFFLIFNNLLQNNKQIVLSSDRPPEKIPDMMERIIHRFMNGLVADIQPPNLETRMAILRKKAENDGLSLPAEVVSFLAANITSNVRELEGSLIRLIASSSFSGRDITLAVAKEILGDLLMRHEEPLSVQCIQQKVADAWGVSANQLSAHTRKRDVSVPRSVAIYLCKKWTRQSLTTIGLEFGRDHSTVIHCCKKIESDLLVNEDLRKKVDEVEQIIKSYL